MGLVSVRVTWDQGSTGSEYLTSTQRGTDNTWFLESGFGNALFWVQRCGVV